MQSDPRAEWERLTHFYAEKSDEELVDLAEDFGNLTDVAQQVLRDEMRKRKLIAPEGKAVADQRPVFGGWNRAETEEKQESDGEAQDVGEDDESGDDVPRAYLCECEDSEQVDQLGEALRRAGIESFAENLHAPLADRDFYTRRIFVRADQLERARDVAARPIPQDIIDQSRVKVEDFEPPACPKCGAEDPLLESVKPSNNWRCENCGARWSDPGPVENEGQNPA
jgi:hypothetical protein